MRGFLSSFADTVSSQNGKRCLFLSYSKNENSRLETTIVGIHVTAKVENGKYIVDPVIVKPKTSEDLQILKDEICNGTKSIADFAESFELEPFAIKFLKR